MVTFNRKMRSFSDLLLILLKKFIAWITNQLIRIVNKGVGAHGRNYFSDSDLPNYARLYVSPGAFNSWHTAKTPALFSYGHVI